MHPIAVRKGMRCSTRAPIPLKLISSQAFETGVLNLVYAPAEPAGSAGYEDAKVHLPQPRRARSRTRAMDSQSHPHGCRTCLAIATAARSPTNVQPARIPAQVAWYRVAHGRYGSPKLVAYCLGQGPAGEIVAARRRHSDGRNGRG